jgi:hypothetical protein
MKHVSAYYLLLLYAVAICRPVFPLLNDVLAHAFWNAEHLVTVHAHQGTNHVHYELKEAAEKENKEAVKGAAFETFSVHLLPDSEYATGYVAVVLQKSITGRCYTLSPFLEKHTPPPKAVFHSFHLS